MIIDYGDHMYLVRHPSPTIAARADKVAGGWQVQANLGPQAFRRDRDGALTWLRRAAALRSLSGEVTPATDRGAQ